MTKISIDLIKKLRERTAAGFSDCKKALEESGGDIEKAIDILRKKGLAIATKRADRETSEGVITSYIHSNKKIGVLVEIDCETDFVARTDEFQQFAHDVAMQIAATNPICISRDQMPQEILEREKKIYEEQLKEAGKPEKIIPKIIEGKLEKFYKENVLLEQNFIKNPEITIQDLLNELIAKTGEKIVIKRFCRFQIGE
ncbi:MAG: translation elongation factor Ts [Thermodesulfobacteriota bacterium]|nr:MAG: translation elongation factor Ts [Thermodesulfobacteriota bacterium]